MYHEGQEIGKYKEYPIVYFPRIMRDSGVSFAAAASTDCGGHLIIVDDDFDLLSEKTEEFAIEHEIGHILFGHLELTHKRIKRYEDKGIPHDIAITMTRRMPYEYMADEHAASVLGKDVAIAALKEFAKITFTRGPGTIITAPDMYLESWLRIRHLKGVKKYGKSIKEDKGA